MHPQPTPQVPPHVRQRDWLAVAGALLAAAAVAMMAWASHGVPPEVRSNLQLGAQFALLHGIAVAALAPLAVKRLARAALVLLLAGVLLFTGSLLAAQLLGTGTALAPLGGSAVILGWLLQAWQRVPR